MGLWNSKAQKVQRGLALLCLNLPPTSLLPSGSARCSVQGTGSGRLPGPKWVGEKEPEGRSTGSLCPERVGEQSRESRHGALGPVLLDQVGVGGHDSSEAGAAGHGKAGFLSARQEVLRTWMEGWVWQGRAYLGSGPRPGPMDYIL